MYTPTAYIIYISDFYRTWHGGLFYKEQELLILHEHLASSPCFLFFCFFGRVRASPLFSFVWCTTLIFIFLLCLVPECLDCPFLIASSVFSNDHLYKVVKSCKTHASRIQTTHMGKTQQLRNYLFWRASRKWPNWNSKWPTFWWIFDLTICIYISR